MLAAPDTPLKASAIVVIDTMEAAEKEIHQRDRKLHIKMRLYNPSMVNEVNLDDYKGRMKEFESIAEDLALSIEDLCLDHAATLGTNKVKELESRRIFVENEVRNYQKLMDEKVLQVRKNVHANLIQGESTFQSESLQLMKKKNEIAQKAVEVMDRDKSD